MTPPVSGGVPEQGLRDALGEIVRLTRGVSGSMITSQVNRIARAALERPRPALPAGTVHEIIRRIQDALPRGEQSLVAPLYPPADLCDLCGGSRWQSMRELQRADGARVGFCVCLACGDAYDAVSLLRASQGGPWKAQPGNSTLPWRVWCKGRKVLSGLSREEALRVRDALNAVAGQGAETPPQPEILR